MAEILDADWFRAAAFSAATLAAITAWRRESVRLDRIGPAGRRVMWPTFWLLLGAVYASMAVALASDLAGRLGGLGREVARNDDWYDSRRPLQAAVVAAIGIVWLAVVVVGVWRVPERRRAYLPSALLCTTLACFAIVRIVSLHQVDTVVARTTIEGVPVGTVIELAGLAIAVVLATVSARRPIVDLATDSELPSGKVRKIRGPVGSET